MYIAAHAVSSYLTFSPLPQDRSFVAVYFSVALSVPHPFPDEDLPVRKCGALCCPDFPPLFSQERQDSLFRCKGIGFIG